MRAVSLSSWASWHEIPVCAEAQISAGSHLCPLLADTSTGLHKNNEIQFFLKIGILGEQESYRCGGLKAEMKEQSKRDTK